MRMRLSHPSGINIRCYTCRSMSLAHIHQRFWLSECIARPIYRLSYIYNSLYLAAAPTPSCPLMDSSSTNWTCSAEDLFAGLGNQGDRFLQTTATQNAKLENEMITSDLHLFIRQSTIIAADALNDFYENNFWWRTGERPKKRKKKSRNREKQFALCYQ